MKDQTNSRVYSEIMLISMIWFTITFLFLNSMKSEMLFNKRLVGFPKMANLVSIEPHNIQMLHVLSDENVLSALNYDNGSIIWQKFFESTVVANLDHKSFIALLARASGGYTFSIFLKENGNLVFKKHFSSGASNLKIFNPVSNIFCAILGNKMVRIDISKDFELTKTMLNISDHINLDISLSEDHLITYQINQHTLTRVEINLESGQTQSHSLLIEKFDSFVASKFGILLFQNIKSGCLAHYLSAKSKTGQDSGPYQLGSLYLDELLNLKVEYINYYPSLKLELFEKIFFLGNSKSPKALALTDDGLLYSFTKNSISLFRDESLSKILAYSDINLPFFTSQYIKSFASVYKNTYLSKQNIIERFLGRLKHDYQLIETLSAHFNPIALALSLMKTWGDKRTENSSLYSQDRPAIILATPGGIFQLLDVNTGVTIWRRNIPQFKTATKIKLMPLNNYQHNSDLPPLYAALAISSNKKPIIWAFDPFDGTDKIDLVLKDHNLCHICEKFSEVVQLNFSAILLFQTNN
ncbi:hypothetical protein MXB_271 [Myxobolus squamalis]|nr:hypothetical protein MXB_271 [Myxobolus squamalis]